MIKDDCADIDAISTEDLLLFVGNTVASDALHVSGCGGVGQSGQGQRDQVFAFEVSEAGIYRFVLSRPAQGIKSRQPDPTTSTLPIAQRPRRAASRCRMMRWC